MKNLNFEKYLLLTILSFFLSSCEKNETINSDLQSFNNSKDEIYNAKSTGQLIDAIYNGNNVQLLEVENGKYLYDGDVLLSREDFIISGESTNGKGVYAGGLWPNRTVRWKYASGVSQSLKDKWVSAINTWKNELNFTFTQISGSTGDYILVQQNSDGSAFSTSIGRSGGQQIISVDPQSFSTGSVIHEIGHAIGLIHEQKRPDRDSFINININNIRPSWQSQYAKCSGCTANGTFDYSSIMLYGSRASSAVVFDPNIPAMTRKDGTTWSAQRSFLSTGDKAAVNAKYK